MENNWSDHGAQFRCKNSPLPPAKIIKMFAKSEGPNMIAPLTIGSQFFKTKVQEAIKKFEEDQQAMRASASGSASYRETLDANRAEKRQGHMANLRERAAKRCKDLNEQRALDYDGA